MAPRSKSWTDSEWIHRLRISARPGPGKSRQFVKTCKVDQDAAEIEEQNVEG